METNRAKFHNQGLIPADIQSMKVGKYLKTILRRFRRECWGPTATEYAVLLVLIVFGAMAAISLMGSLLSNSMQSMADAVPDGSGEATSKGSGSGKDKKDKKGKKGGGGKGKKASARGFLRDIASTQNRHRQTFAGRTYTRHS